LITNRIVNGGFETGSLLPFSGSNVSISSIRHSGPFSAMFLGGTSEGRLTQLISVVPGESFEFFTSIVKIGNAASPRVSIVISYLDNELNLKGTALSIDIPVGNIPIYWREIYMTTTPAPSGTTQARVEITKYSLSGSASVVVDDVALLAVNGTAGGAVAFGSLYYFSTGEINYYAPIEGQDVEFQIAGPALNTIPDISTNSIQILQDGVYEITANLTLIMLLNGRQLVTTAGADFNITFPNYNIQASSFGASIGDSNPDVATMSVTVGKSVLAPLLAGTSVKVVCISSGNIPDSGGYNTQYYNQSLTVKRIQ
jgi:hypothetical protein